MRLTVVTGAGGFLGSEVVRQLRAAGVSVRGTGRRAVAAAGGEFQIADIMAPGTLAGVMAGADTVVHCAGLAHVFGPERDDASRFTAVNETGTENVVRAAAAVGVRNMVVISSVGVYGTAPDARTESTPCRPEGPYAVSKLRAERRALDLAAPSGMQVTILRMATLYGEGDRGNVARLMRAIDRGRFVPIGDGSNQKSLLHRDDAARAVVAVVTRPAAGGGIYNVSASPCSMRDVVDGLASALGRRPWPVRIPAGLALTAARAARRIAPGRLGGVEATLRKWLADDMYDGSAFRAAFGFEPAVGLTAGLARQVAWYRAPRLMTDSQCRRP